MATETLRLSRVFPISPDRLYAAWLDSGEHARFTGGDASIDANVGGAHSAWDGYIWGRILELDRGRRILQTWRTTEFPEGSEDSQVEILFEPAEGGTRITLVHTDIPEGQRMRYETSWEDFYFEPMAQYFKRPAKRAEGNAEPASLTKTKPARKAKPLGKAKATRKAKAATKAMPARESPSTKRAKTTAKAKSAPKRKAAGARKKAASSKTRRAAGGTRVKQGAGKKKAARRRSARR